MALQGELELQRWDFAGPVAKAFEVSRAPVAMIVGPTGGGKSTASARRCLRVATWQHPSPRDGIRRARTVCICPTYRRAWDTVMPSYFKVFPQTMGLFRGSRGDPADHIFETRLNVAGRETRVHVEVLFRAVQDLDIEDFFRGFEFTAVWLPEADTNGDLANVLSLASNRVGRYPEPDDRPSDADDAYVGIWGDANAPMIGTPFHDRFFLKTMPDGAKSPDTDRLFVQPSGFSANAENMMNLRKIRKDFYAYQSTQLDPYDVGRLLKNIPGYGRHGQPVHANFNPEEHVARGPIEIDCFAPVFISIDAGSNTLHPAAVFWQRSGGGQWKALDEIFLPKGVTMNNAAFCEALLQTYNRRFHDLNRDFGALICSDPAAAGKNAHSEYSTAAEIQALTSIEVMLAPTNKLPNRRSALDKLFLSKSGPRDPKIIIDPRCKGLIGGLSGGFHYARRGNVVSPQPVKNEYSHVCEAAEYGPLTVDGMDAEEGRFIRPDGAHGYDAPLGIYAD